MEFAVNQAGAIMQRSVISEHTTCLLPLPRHEPRRDTTFFPTDPRQAFWIFLTMCSRQLLPSDRTGTWNGSLKRNKIPERIFQILDGEVGETDSSCYRNRDEGEAYISLQAEEPMESSALRTRRSRAVSRLWWALGTFAFVGTFLHKSKK